MNPNQAYSGVGTQNQYGVAMNTPTTGGMTGQQAFNQANVDSQAKADAILHGAHCDILIVRPSEKDKS